MVKKYKINLTQILKRNRKVFDTKAIAKKLDASHIANLSEKLAEDINVINIYLNKVKFRKNKINEFNDNSLVEDVNKFISRKKSCDVENLKLKSKFNISILENMFHSENKMFPNAKTIQTYYNHITGNKAPSHPYINNILRKRLKIRYKKFQIRNKNLQNEISNIQTMLYIIKFAEEITENSNIIYIDETKMKNDKNSKRCWMSLKNNSKIYDNGRIEGVNIFGALSKKEILSLYTSPKNLNGDTFMEYIKKLEKELKVKKIQNPVIVLDNCSSHKGTDVKKYVKKSSLKFVFLPCYLAELNSIEYLWNNLKQFARKEVIISK